MVAPVSYASILSTAFYAIATPNAIAFGKKFLSSTKINSMIKKIFKELGIMAVIAAVLYVALTIISQDLPMILKLALFTKSGKLYLLYFYVFVFIYVYSFYADWKVWGAQTKAWPKAQIALNAFLFLVMAYALYQIGHTIHWQDGEVLVGVSKQAKAETTLLKENAGFKQLGYVVYVFHILMMGLGYLKLRSLNKAKEITEV